MNHIDLNRLKTLIAIVEAGSVSAAAKKLFRTQPAISSQLAQLEAELEVKLFEKQGRKLTLTRAGEDLYKIAGQQISQLEEAVLHITKGELSKAGTLRIAAIPDLGHQLILPILKKFKLKFPKIQLQISFGPSELVEEYLLNRRYDIGFVTDVHSNSKFEAEHIAKIENVLVVHKSYLKKNPQAKPKFEDIFEMEWIDCVPNWRMVSFWVKENYPQQHDLLLTRKPTLVVDTFQAMLSAACEGLGFTVVPRFLAKKHLSSGLLVEPIKKTKTAISPVIAIQHVNHFRNYVERSFLEMAVENKTY